MASSFRMKLGNHRTHALHRRKYERAKGGSDTDECHRTAHSLGSTEALRGISVRFVGAADTIEGVYTPTCRVVVGRNVCTDSVQQ